MSQSEQNPQSPQSSVVVVTTPPQSANPPAEKSETSLNASELVQLGEVLESNRQLMARMDTMEQERAELRQSLQLTEQSLASLLVIAESEPEPEQETESSEELELVEPEPEPEPEPESEPEPEPEPEVQKPKWVRVLFGE